MATSGRISSGRISSSELRRNSSTGEIAFSRSSARADELDDDEALKWAALEKLPTYLRIRRGLLNEAGDDGGHSREVEIADLGILQKRNLLERLVRIADEGNEKFLLKLKSRIDRVGLEMPAIEVRFEQLNVAAEARVGGRALPTVFNFSVNVVEGMLDSLRVLPSRKKPLSILRGVSGIIKP